MGLGFMLQGLVELIGLVRLFGGGGVIGLENKATSISRHRDE